MTTKIIDNTVVSASLKEITCINLIAKCLEKYPISTSIEVHEETKEMFSQKMDCYKKISVYDLHDNKLFIVLIEYLSNRYPYLHKGELSSFLVALIEYELKSKEYYFVTDDNRMKKVASKLLQDELFTAKLTKKPAKLNITGTIGLLKRLCQRGVLTKEEISDVVIDLQKSTFYITPELIKSLRDC